MRRLNVVLLFAAAMVCLAAWGPAHAESAYPNRPIKLVVPYPPGGPTDIIGRLTAARLGALLGQTVYVENVAGANGNIGCAAVARAAPDGYTLLMGSAGPLTINPSLYQKIPFNSLTDFAPIGGLVAEVPLVLVVGPTVKVKSLSELVAQAKARPGELTFASSGNGSTQHLGGELLKIMAGVDMRHIPYKGAALGLNDVLAGRVDLMVELTPTALPHIASGRLHPIAVTTPKRLPSLPEVPTLDEAGLRGYEITTWFGVVAPARTPPGIIGRLNELLVKAAQEPAIQSQLAAQGARTVQATPREFEGRIKSESAKWSKVVKDANVRID